MDSYSAKTVYGVMTAEYKEVLGAWAIYLGSILVKSEPTREAAIAYIRANVGEALV